MSTRQGRGGRPRTFFEWVLPQRWRKQKVFNETEAVLALAGIPDNDKALKVLTELIVDQFQVEVLAAIGSPKGKDNPGVNIADLRAYQCGRAAALLSLLDRIEAAREEARDLVAQRQKAEGRMQK